MLGVWCIYVWYDFIKELRIRNRTVKISFFFPAAAQRAAVHFFTRINTIEEPKLPRTNIEYITFFFFQK